MTPWGAATLVEEAVVPQRAGDKRFSVVVQLLETPSGERLIRFAYTTDGTARRVPSRCGRAISSDCGRRSSARPFLRTPWNPLSRTQGARRP